MVSKDGVHIINSIIPKCDLSFRISNVIKENTINGLYLMNNIFFLNTAYHCI